MYTRRHIYDHGKTRFRRIPFTSLARLAHRSQDPRVRTLASEVGDLRSSLAAAARGGEPKAFETALQALEAKQLALGQVSRDYKDHLRARLDA